MDIKMLQTTGLFQGMSKEEVSLALTALEAAEKILPERGDDPPCGERHSESGTGAFRQRHH